MFYSLLGRIVWFVAKRYAIHKYGRLRLPLPVVALGVIASTLAAVVIGQRKLSS